MIKNECEKEVNDGVSSSERGGQVSYATKIPWVFGWSVDADDTIEDMALGTRVWSRLEKPFQGTTAASSRVHRMVELGWQWWDGFGAWVWYLFTRKVAVLGKV